MPPKGRKSLTLWHSCENCKCTLNVKDLENHVTECPISGKDWNHGFISDRTLHGFGEIVESEDLGNAVLNEIKHDLVMVSQSAMQLCEFPLGSPVLVSANDFKLIKKVWPTNKGNLTTVRLFRNGCDHVVSNGNETLKVKVSSLKEFLPAKEVVFKVVGEKARDMSILQETLSHHPNSKYIWPSGRIKINLYGKTVIIEILRCTEVEGRIEELMENMSLEDRFYLSSGDTKWVLSEKLEEVKPKEFPLRKIGGYENLISEIKENINFALNLKKKTGTQKCYGVLLYGAHGTGKTLIAKTIASETKANILNIQSTELFSKYYGETESRLRSAFKSATDKEPSIIILDNVETLAPRKGTDQERRVVSALLSLFDEIASKSIIIIATTNRPDDIDPGLRRPGRLEEEMEIPVPTAEDKYSILCTLTFDEGLHKTFSLIGESSHGFVAADLHSLWNKACVKVVMDNRDKVTGEDLLWALSQVKPSAMREVYVQVPNVLWSDIGGMNELKLKLQQAVEWPIRHPDSFRRLGISPPRGVLMFGPPGCSKTMIAKALATESKLNFLTVKGSDIFSKWVGESEKAVRDLFRRARSVAPAIIFLDEVDALGSERETGSSGGGGDPVRERVLSQLLTEMDGVQSLKNVVIIAATNRPDRLDKALLRPGRLDRLIYVPLPNLNTRTQILRLQLSIIPTSPCVNIEELAEKTSGYSGAEVVAVCKEAALKALEEDINTETVNMEHFHSALSLVTPRTPRSLLDLYKDYMDSYKLSN